MSAEKQNEEKKVDVPGFQEGWSFPDSFILLPQAEGEENTSSSLPLSEPNPDLHTEGRRVHLIASKARDALDVIKKQLIRSRPLSPNVVKALCILEIVIESLEPEIDAQSKEGRDTPVDSDPTSSSYFVLLASSRRKPNEAPAKERAFHRFMTQAEKNDPPLYRSRSCDSVEMRILVQMGLAEKLRYALYRPT
ncbi:MAG: hypothetical protein KDD64_17480, partial [Bdellovibrionales bacterium]|nr:hypothetical protein [Bdellovibrionales bacterium]